MKIGQFWLINYIKNNGTKIIIPKEVTHIYGFGNAIKVIETELGHEEGIEIIFEEESQIEEIGDFAFSGCKVKNDVVIPKSIKRIGWGAFSRCLGDFRLERDSNLEECNDSSVFSNEETINIPQNLGDLSLGDCEKAKAIQIPEQSKISNIFIARKSSNLIRRIETPNGNIILADDEYLVELHIEDNLYYLIYQKQLEKGEIKNFFAVFDKKTLQKNYEVNLLQKPYTSIDGLVVTYDNIWGCELEKINSIPHEIYIHLRSDENVSDEYKPGDTYAREGKIYTKDEIQEIQEKLKLIISKINVPPDNIKDREKIIYSQIVKQLGEDVQYDYQTAERMDEESIFDENGYYDKEKEKQIDETQNLKGLLKTKTVCKGFATIIQTLCAYYNIDCKVVKNNKHAWNSVNLDGEVYEDDFTWYKDDLQTSNILGMNSFLKGKDKTGKRELDELEYHEIDIDMNLSESLTKNKRFNLLTTDWSLITDWENVSIDKDINTSSYIDQIRMLAESKVSMCLLAKNKNLSKVSINLKTFCEKIKNFFRNRGNLDEER